MTGQVAQLVEQRTENPRVGSSILPLATQQDSDYGTCPGGFGQLPPGATGQPDADDEDLVAATCGYGRRPCASRSSSTRRVRFDTSVRNASSYARPRPLHPRPMKGLAIHTVTQPKTAKP